MAALVVLVCFLVSGADHVGADEMTFNWWLGAFPGPENARLSSDIAAGARELDALLILPRDASFHRRVDTARRFVNAHSVHNPDEEFFSYWYSVWYLMKRLAASARDESAPKVHLECATRTAVLYHMLEDMGVRVRIAVIYHGTDGDHTLLEVFDRETGGWEVEDADFDVFWKFRGTQKRASLEDLLRYPVKESFVPCRDESHCGYTSLLESVVPLFAMAVRLDIRGGTNAALINSARYSKLQLFEDYQPWAKPYCALFVRGCGQDVVEIPEK